MRNGNVLKNTWFNIVSCVVASIFNRSTFSFCATHETPKQAMENVNVYIPSSRRLLSNSHITDLTKTKKLFEIISNNSRMVFAKIAMNRRFLSIFTNSKHLRFWHSHLLNRSGSRKKSFNNSIKINNTKNFQVRAIDKASCIIEDMALPITRSSSIAFILDNSFFKSVLLNKKLWKNKKAYKEHKPIFKESLNETR
ncbi:MAG: hypothetical protein PHQ52_06860 [Candidatus Omnitrophica bacterium]|nr:hypothetical protein [Candidatus Omnitrophota bacterium]